MRENPTGEPMPPRDSRSAADLARRNVAVVWLVPFFALLAASLGLFAITAWIEGIPLPASAPEWLTRLDTRAALDSMSNAAEVVAAVLGIAITVVAIVVELAANRYTHRITELFTRAPVNGLVMGFFVMTTGYCVWMSATLGGREAQGGDVPYGAVSIALLMVSLSLLLLIPYFAFVFAFLQPLNVVDRIRGHAFQVVRRAARAYRPGLRAEMVTNLEQLEDVAMNAMGHKDRGISIAAADALYEFLHDYSAIRDTLEDAWFELDRSLARDASFIAMAPHAQKAVARDRLWVEMKVLRQYHSIYTEALNEMRSIAYLIALNTRRVAEESLAGRRYSVFDLALRIFNSYLRAGINQKDVRTTYYTLHHYRGLAEAALQRNESERALEIASYLRYYGQLAFGERMPFVLEAVAYDMAQVCEVAFECDSKDRDRMLELFLTVDKESEHPDQESTLRGVRRAQVQLATFFLARGDTERARQVYDDMAQERPERLASIREELLTEDSPDYWEVTDRGVNFGYLPPERRARVEEFFEWFGSRVPRRRNPIEQDAVQSPSSLRTSRTGVVAGGSSDGAEPRL